MRDLTQEQGRGDQLSIRTGDRRWRVSVRQLGLRLSEAVVPPVAISAPSSGRICRMVITSTLTPTVSYDDAGAAIRWLADVLGLSEADVYDGPDGNVVFAQLVWRTGIVFISARAPADNPWAKVGPASIALAAEDADTVDRLHERTVAAGAEINRPIHDAVTPAFPEGSHQFDLRDPEGNLWTVATFQPRFSLSGPRDGQILEQ